MGSERSGVGGDLPSLLTTTEAASYLRVSGQTLANWRTQGKGPPFCKVGGRVAYRLAGVVSWTRKQETEGPGGDGFSKVQISTRPYKKDPTRQHVDIMFPHPLQDAQIYRKRIVAPRGMDPLAAKEWGMHQARDLLRSFCKMAAPGDKEVSTHKSTDQRQQISPTVPTLAEFWARFEANYICERKLSTRDGYDSIWRIHLRPMFGSLPIDQLGRREFAQLRTTLREKNLSSHTRNQIVGKLHRALRWALNEGIIDDNLPRLGREEVMHKHKAVFEPADLERLLAVCKSVQEEVLVLLCWHGALRIGETAGLMWADIDWSNRTMMICRNVMKGTLQETPKGEIGAVPLSPRLLGALLRLKDEQGSRHAFVLQWMHKGRLTHTTDRTNGGCLRRIQKHAGLPVAGPHILRHTALTHGARAGVSPYALQAFARHSHMETTMRYYIHLDRAEVARQAVDIFADAPIAESTKDPRDNELATPGKTAPKPRKRLN